jgi:hypothetical protein
VRGPLRDRTGRESCPGLAAKGLSFCTSAPLAMKASLIRTCTGPRPLDGVGGRLRGLRWCGHFITDLGISELAGMDTEQPTFRRER